MGLEWEELKLPGLGRPAFLGQLYNATTEKFLNSQVFDPETVKNTQTVKNAYTGVKYKDVSSITDRADALDINAELSVSILGGMIELKGSGQYLDTSKSNVSSREVTMVCTILTNLKRIDLNDSTYITKQAFERAQRRGATHAVTGIIYGGNLITNIIEKTSSSESQNKIHGEFSASIMKEMASKFSAEGKASVDMDKKAKDVAASKDFEVCGDYSSAEQPNPTTVGDVFELAKKWPELVGEGVPMHIIVTPLMDLVDNSVEGKMVHQLESDELAAILETYDKIYLLAGKRTRVQTVLELGLGQQCPTFLEQCRKRKSVVDGVLGKARKALSKYLTAYRDGGVEKAGDAAKFLEGVQEGYDEYLKECKGDESTLGLLQDIAYTAVDRQSPIHSLAELRTLMTQAAKGMLGVVLIPTAPNIDGVVNMFDVLVANIRKWRAEEDKKDVDAEGNARKTRFVSYYCDPALKSELLKLDGKRKVLAKALDGFEETSVPRFVHYGELPSGLVQKQYDWSLLNDEGWAFLSNEQESWYYVGQVSGGKRHGRGTVTYADGSTYTGDWWKDTRHGQGDLVDKNKKISGVFIDDQYRSDGSVVDLTIVAHHSPIAAYKIPLRERDSTTSHVLRIGLMLGWTDRDEYKLAIEEAGTGKEAMALVVVGHLLKPGQESIATKAWPLDKGVRIRGEKR